MRKLTVEEVNEKLEQHKLWLADRSQGKRFDASDCYFTKEVNFEEQDLRMAIFTRSSCEEKSFRGADLRGADFRWANASRSDFRGANCNRADFYWANLFRSSFLGTKGKWRSAGAICGGW